MAGGAWGERVRKRERGSGKESERWGGGWEKRKQEARESGNAKYRHQCKPTIAFDY